MWNSRLSLTCYLLLSESAVAGILDDTKSRAAGRGMPEFEEIIRSPIGLPMLSYAVSKPRELTLPVLGRW